MRKRRKPNQTNMENTICRKDKLNNNNIIITKTTKYKKKMSRL